MSDSDSRQNRPESFHDAHEAAKRKIEYQVDVMESLDNKALRTFRYVLLTAGVVLSGLSIKGVQFSLSPETANDYWNVVLGLTLSVSGFFLSTISALMAARVANIDLGPTHEEINDVIADRPSQGEWLESALERQSGHIEQNTNQLKSDKWYLMVSQFCFVIMFLGLFLLFFGIF